MDILRMEDGSDMFLVCSSTSVFVWDMDSSALLASISLPASDSSSRQEVVNCRFDPHQGIVVLGYHIGERRHALYRITTAPWQPHYPALHDQVAFAQMLQTFAGGQASISVNGIITVQIGNQRYQLIADDTVEAADSGRGQGIHEVTDRNGDNLPDFLLVFPDQKQQLLYLLPAA